MVWEQHSSIIVMMTKLEERARIKCDQYWPSRGTEIFQISPSTDPKLLDYSALSVTLLDSTEFAYYTIRSFSLEMMTYSAGQAPTGGSVQRGVGGYTNGAMTESFQTISEKRQIKQFQFTAWPDCGAPEQPQPLLLFIRQVCRARNLMHQSRRPDNGAPPGSTDAKSTPNTHDGRLGPVIVHCSAGVGRTGGLFEYSVTASI